MYVSYHKQKILKQTQQKIPLASRSFFKRGFNIEMSGCVKNPKIVFSHESLQSLWIASNLTRKLGVQEASTFLYSFIA